MHVKLKLSAIILLLSACSIAHAQTDTSLIDHHVKALDNYAIRNPVEKVHLHLDRAWYGLGDTIWFKAYTVVGYHHRLSALSGVLYAELISPGDSVLQRLTLRLNSGTSSGRFVVPYNFKPGDYRIRAYTNWMRNDDPAYFYNQQINIGGVDPQPQSTVAVKTNSLIQNTGAPQIQGNNIDIQFFPEGGYLVNGLRSKVAFKAINKNGLAANIQGVIVDGDNNEVAVFNTQHEGMGQFPLMPQAGKQYRAKITNADSTHFFVDLPKARDNGFTLTVNNARDSIYIQVAANAQLFQNHTDTAFYLIGQSGGRSYFTTGSKLVSRVFSIIVPASRFPAGIARFSLFSQSGEPLNERVIFIQNNKLLHLAAKTDKETYAPKEPVNINLLADSAVTGSFSVSVTDETQVPVDEQNEPTIFTDLLLKSELKGDIVSPNYYFINQDDKTRSDLDLLMLTQGYRRFEWKRILEREAAGQIEGLVKDVNGKVIAGAKVSLVSLANNLNADTLTDKNGRFVFEDLNIADSSRLFIKLKDKEPQPFNIYVLKPNQPGNQFEDNTYSDTTKQISGGTGQPLKGKPVTATATKKGIALTEVTIKSNKNEKPDLRNRYGTDDSYTIPGERLKDFASVGTGLLSTVPGLLIDGHGRYATIIRGHIVPVSIVIDTHRIEQQNVDEEVSADDVYDIKLVRYDDYALKLLYGLTQGGKASGDVIAITTKRSLGIHSTYTGTKDTIVNGLYCTTTLKPAADLVYIFRNDKADSVAFIPEQDLSLSGTIKTLSGKPVADGRIKLTSVKDLFVTDTVSDLNGNFTFTGIELNDSTKVVIDAKKAKGGNNVSISIHQPGAAPLDKIGWPGFEDISATIPDAVLSAQKQAFLAGRQQASKNSIQLNEVKINEKRNTYFNPVYSENMKFSSNLNGPGNADEVILSDKLMSGGGGRLSDILPSKILGLNWKNGVPYSFHTTHLHQPPMALFVEGAQESINMLDDINPDDIYSIEVLTSTAFLAPYGSNAPGGALIITLKHGANPDTAKVTVDGLITYNFKGFYKARAFYSPKYSQKSVTAATDERQTIYWNPYVITGADGKASFSYFNAGNPGTYRVVIEGIDAKGNLGRQVFRYKVE